MQFQTSTSDTLAELELVSDLRTFETTFYLHEFISSPYGALKAKDEAEILTLASYLISIRV